MTSTINVADKFSRPISAYDNLGKSEVKKCARVSLDGDVVKNGGFPFTEITFKFDDIPTRRVNASESDVMGRSDAGDVTLQERREGQSVRDERSSPPGSQCEKRDADKSQYVNLSETVQSDELRRQNHKTSISSAKSNFFGLNGTTESGQEDKGVVPRRRIRLKMDDDEDSEEYGEETVKLLPEVVNTFNTPANASSSNSYQNIPLNSHKFQQQLSYVQEMKLVESSSSSESPGKSDVIPRIKNPARSSSPDSNSHRLSQPSQVNFTQSPPIFFPFPIELSSFSITRLSGGVFFSFTITIPIARGSVANDNDCWDIQ